MDTCNFFISLWKGGGVELSTAPSFCLTRCWLRYLRDCSCQCFPAVLLLSTWGFWSIPGAPGRAQSRDPWGV